MWHFAKSLPLCDLSDAVQDAGYQQSDDDKAAENDEAEKAPSHRLAPTMCKPRSMTPLLFAGAGARQPRTKAPYGCFERYSRTASVASVHKANATS